MSRLNTMYPDDEFLKNISDIMGKLDNKNEREIKQEIEQIGYKEFYRYYKEKDVYIKQLQQENEQLKDNWNKLKEYFNERIEVCDNRLSSPFCNFEKATKERLIFTQCLEKLEELEQGSDSDE